MIYYCIAEGLGNIIQTTPAFNFLKKQGHEIGIICHEKFMPTAQIVYKNAANIFSSQLGNGKLIKSVCIDGYNRSDNLSEVTANLILAGCRNPKAEDKIGFCDYEEYDRSYDILLCNGYNKSCSIQGAWEVKSYLYWEALAQLLIKDYKVASIGLPQEYIKGTFNETGVGLGKTLGLLKNCKLMICNDTGFYHAANIFSIKNLVIFTMTDLVKNYDSEFHRYTTTITKGLPCQPCQFTTTKECTKLYWLYNKPHCHWVCRDIDVNDVYKKARELL